MKDNRGFSLVELLAVIVILAIVGVIAIGAIDLVNRENKKQGEEAYIANVIASAISHVPTSVIMLPDAEMTRSGLNEILPDNITTFSGCGRLIVTSTIPTGSNICEVRINIAHLIDEGVIDGDLKNPITNKKLDYSKSYISIIRVSDSGGANVSTNDLKDLNGKYDGRYYYRYKEVFHEE